MTAKKLLKIDLSVGIDEDQFEDAMREMECSGHFVFDIDHAAEIYGKAIIKSHMAETKKLPGL